MKVAELKKELKSRGLSTTGNKNELIERLQLAVMPENTEEEDSDLLADASEILGEDATANASEILGEDATANAAEEPEAPVVEEEAQPAPKVAIKRDAVVPATPTPAESQEKTEETTKEAEPSKETEPAEVTAPEAESSTTPKGKQKSNCHELEMRPELLIFFVLSPCSCIFC